MGSLSAKLYTTFAGFAVETLSMTRFAQMQKALSFSSSWISLSNKWFLRTCFVQSSLQHDMLGYRSSSSE
jgi:hypothetical protein